MKETQQSICAWAEETFGPVTNPLKLVSRAQQEMAELAEAVQHDDRAEIGKETADVIILLYRLLEHHGLDLPQEVEDKMAINRSRQWVPAGDGTGKHRP